MEFFIIARDRTCSCSQKKWSESFNDGEVLAILEAFKIFSYSFQEGVIVESDSSAAIHWVSSLDSGPWSFHFRFNEINAISSSLYVSFTLVRRLANGMADSLAKQGVDRVFPFFSSLVWIFFSVGIWFLYQRLFVIFRCARFV